MSLWPLPEKCDGMDTIAFTLDLWINEYFMVKRSRITEVIDNLSAS